MDDKTGLLLASFVFGLFAIKAISDIRSEKIESQEENASTFRKIYLKLESGFGYVILVWVVLLLTILYINWGKK
jgi:hypothetical protein